MSDYDHQEASVAYLPTKAGDGYEYGGGTILKIASFAFDFGPDKDRGEIALRLALLWNEARENEGRP